MILRSLRHPGQQSHLLRGKSYDVVALCSRLRPRVFGTRTPYLSGRRATLSVELKSTTSCMSQYQGVPKFGITALRGTRSSPAPAQPQISSSRTPYPDRSLMHHPSSHALSAVTLNQLLGGIPFVPVYLRFPV